MNGPARARWVVAVALALLVAGLGINQGATAARAAVEPVAYHGLTPARLLDTRDGIGVTAGSVGAGGVVDLDVTGRGGVPEFGAGAVVLNVTATMATAPTYVTVWPTGPARSSAHRAAVGSSREIPSVRARPDRCAASVSPRAGRSC